MKEEYFETESCSRIYKSRINYTILSFVFVVLATALLVKEIGLLLMLPFGILYFYLTLQNFHRNKEKIILTNSYIEYYGANYSFRVNWDKISRIKCVKDIAGVQEGLLVEYRNAENLSLRSLRIPPSIPKELFMPLSCFSDNWRDSELGQRIKQYAPHLFK